MRTVIEINGRKYDTQTGEILEQKKSSNNTHQTNSVTKKLPINPRSNGQIIDGVSRRKEPFIPIPKHSSNTALNSDKKVIDKMLSRPKADIITPIKKPQKSKTLLRSVVNKPVTKIAYIHSMNTLANAHDITHVKKLGFPTKPQHIDLRNITKSPHISKFANKASKPVSPKLEPNLLIKSHPIAANTHISHTPPLTKINVSSVKIKKYDLNHAISVATSHTQKRHVIKHKSRINPKIFIISAGILVLAGLAGYFSYNRVPQLSLQIAASNAGFNGHLPNNTPSGYALKSPIESAKGNIVLNYSSNSDGRKFVISQKPSNWSSESLLSNVFKQSKLNYQTYHDKGLTVYVYGGSNATWVNNGVWYTVTGHDALSSQQLLALAGSM